MDEKRECETVAQCDAVLHALLGLLLAIDSGPVTNPGFDKPTRDALNAIRVKYSDIRDHATRNIAG